MKTSNIAVRLTEVYAKAIFELAGESMMQDTVKYNLDDVAAVIANETDFRMLLGSPYFTSEYKEQLLRKIFMERISTLIMDFLMVIHRHNRLMLLPQIIAKYNELWDTSNGHCPVKVTVSEAVDDDEIKEITKSIETAVNRKVRLKVAVDPAIIGGISVRYDDKVIDNTVRNRLITAVKTIKDRAREWVKAHEV